MTDPHQEFALIDWIRRQAAPHLRVPLGIGDDAAVVDFPAPTACLVTVDMLMEGVDFVMPQASPPRVGRKALAVSLSDIAAMAGRPVAAFVSLALPRRGGDELARGLYAGLQPLAKEFDVSLAGGDTNSWDGPLVISVTVLGEAVGRGPVPRSGAQPGDWVMTTGDFGGSLTGKHLDFSPRVREALTLHAAAHLHAMIDVSDGLAADLWHLLDESRVGAVLDAHRIPISPAAACANDGRTPLEHALGDGEDFELVFSVSPADGEKLLASSPCGIAISRIGEIVSGRECRLRDALGNFTPLPPTGWRHTFS